ncbi:MAG: 3-isopropylmalate dehydratase small subunit [Planctomycetaceae bacterium]|jgi:3-isopropylmalate/(R)-2-methylmalate dehydratase small subunit|nr:3-isopropylmalate dehydratase small subunit [Planctomycetaceae bacterium]
MRSFIKHTGIVIPLDRNDVDTDQIIPKQFLKRIERTGFGKFAFYDWRYKDDHFLPDPEFELNKPEFQGGTILLTRCNFGCGSSREHAPWALDDFGFRVILACSFADIFYNNCFQNGMLPIRLSETVIDELFKNELAGRPYKLTIDLENCVISDNNGLVIPFTIDASKRRRLLNGLDDVGITLNHEEKITEYEKLNGIFYAG